MILLTLVSILNARIGSIKMFGIDPPTPCKLQYIQVVHCFSHALLMNPVDSLPFQVKLSKELSWPLKQALGKAFPYTWLSREGLMECPQIALLACELIAAEMLEHLKPSVSFTEGTASGDDTPYTVNVPVKREGETDATPLTQLEVLHSVID